MAAPAAGDAPEAHVVTTCTAVKPTPDETLAVAEPAGAAKNDAIATAGICVAALLTAHEHTDAGWPCLVVHQSAKSDANCAG